MKFLVIISFFFLGMAWHHCDAQSAFREGGKRSARSCSPITIVMKSQTLLDLGGLSLCADLSVNKNSLPQTNLGGNILKQYHGSTPIYGSFAMSPTWALEGGAYIGIVANRAEQLGERPLPAYVDPGLNLGFDSGLVSGLSFDLEKFGKLRLRYNYGLSEIARTDDRIIKTRRLDLGFDIKF